MNHMHVPRETTKQCYPKLVYDIHELLVHRHLLKMHNPLVQKLPPNLRPNPNG